MSLLIAPAPTRSRPGRLLAVMCAGMFLVLLDVTAVNVALPSIGRGFDAGLAGLQSTVDGYAVAIAALLLAAGTAGDRFGHRRVVLAGFTVFGLASLGCALSPGIEVLLACRVVQGAGAALLLPGTMALIADAYPSRQAQARALGMWAAVSSVALPAGPLIGGALVSASSWRLVFWINVPVVAIVLVATLRVVAAAPGRRAGRFDAAGTACFALALASAVVGIIELGHGARPAFVAAAWALAVVATTAGLRAEARHPNPIVPLSLVRERRFLAPNLVALSMNLVFNGTLFVAMLYLQDVRGLSPAAAGGCVLPMAVPLVILAPLSGSLTARYGPRTAIAAGCGVGALGGVLLTLIGRGGSLTGVLLPLGVTGVAGGLITASVVAAAVRAVPADRSGLATGVSNTARQAGTASGVALFGAIAGDPAGAHFVAGLHALAYVSVALWLAALGLTMLGVERAPRPTR